MAKPTTSSAVTGVRYRRARENNRGLPLTSEDRGATARESNRPRCDRVGLNEMAYALRRGRRSGSRQTPSPAQPAHAVCTWKRHSIGSR